MIFRYFFAFSIGLFVGCLLAIVLFRYTEDSSGSMYRIMGEGKTLLQSVELAFGYKLKDDKEFEREILCAVTQNRDVFEQLYKNLEVSNKDIIRRVSEMKRVYMTNVDEVFKMYGVDQAVYKSGCDT